MYLIVNLFVIIAIFYTPIIAEYVHLPGNNMLTNLRLKTGYLEAGTDLEMFYMLLEARDVPLSNAPLIIWFNGGPGCSSLGAFFEEFGPLYVNFEASSLFENPYSWYHKINILFIESPIGVGFSYHKNESFYSTADDDSTALQNFRAVEDFFRRHTEFAQHKYYIAAESYGGVYGPMLSAMILESIERSSFVNPFFQGLIIGNGFMNVKLTTNTMILWSAYHARTSPDEWEDIKTYCRTPGARDVDEYDFTMFMVTPNNMDYVARKDSKCGQLLRPLIGSNFNDWDGYDFFNYYHDCYANYSKPFTKDPVNEILRLLPQRGISALLRQYASDDTLSYRCWSDVALNKYLNRRDVQHALKVSDIWKRRNEKWTFCNDKMYEQYRMKHQDMTPFFDRIIRSVNAPSFRILIYNGDIDTACNYLADQYFIRSLARRHQFQKIDAHQPWFYSKNRVIAGYFQRYSGEGTRNSKISIDVVSVKGAGHFVPFDRPGPSYQIINNFVLHNLANYSRSYEPW